MILFLSILHVLLCVVLVAIVLLQHGKGADMGVALGGGGSQTVFGARGAGSFLSKLTTGAAVLFMVTSLLLSFLGGPHSPMDLLEQVAPPAESPLAPGAAPAATEEQPGDVPQGFEEIPAPAPGAGGKPAGPGAGGGPD